MSVNIYKTILKHNIHTITHTAFFHLMFLEIILYWVLKLLLNWEHEHFINPDAHPCSVWARKGKPLQKEVMF